jgi:preprotein translocase subunit YajC
VNQFFSLLALQAGGSSGPGLKLFMFQMLAFVGIIYFLMIRPKIKQEKEHKEKLGALKKGDKVVTTGGIIGEIVHIKDGSVTLKSGDTRLLVQKERIAEVGGDRPEEPKKQ